MASNPEVLAGKSTLTAVLRAMWFKVILGCLAFVGPVLASSAGDLTQVDREVPVFSLPSAGAAQWQRDDLAGKAWVINFWASWCSPCIEEIPAMNRAWDKLEPLNIGMLAINAGEGREVVDDFLNRIPIDFPTLLGDADTLPDWSIRALPTTVVVNSDGQVILEALGPREWDDDELLQKVISAL